jgi:hypothetical protein
MLEGGYCPDEGFGVLWGSDTVFFRFGKGHLYHERIRKIVLFFLLVARFFIYSVGKIPEHLKFLQKDILNRKYCHLMISTVFVQKKNRNGLVLVFLTSGDKKSIHLGMVLNRTSGIWPIFCYTHCFIYLLKNKL